jgi:4-hydroxybenzoate polyprenyltransferase
MKHLWRLARPKQWSKNLLVFAAYLFSARWHDPFSTEKVLAAFVAMCCASSATYVFNDLMDRERDRAHPVKCNRPIAAGLVSPPVAVLFGLLLLLAAVVLGVWTGPWAIAILTGYIVIQVLYNVWLKSLPVADVFIISFGFVLRAVFGAQAIDVPISGWLLFCTGALALMLGFAKRRNEFLAQGEDRGESRESLVHYNRHVLDLYVGMFAGVAIMSFGIYCLDSQTARAYQGVLMTFPFVAYGISRYILLVFTQNEGGEPAELLFKDLHVFLSVLGFVVAALIAVRGTNIPIVGH